MLSSKRAPSCSTSVDVCEEEAGESTTKRPVLTAEESLDFEYKDLALSFSTASSEDSVVDILGDLFITNKRVIWLGKNGSEAFTFECDVPYITMHALCRDPKSFPKPCIYCQLYTDEDALDYENGEGTDYEVDSKEDIKQTETNVFTQSRFMDKAMNSAELYLIPSKGDESESGLQSIFDALSQAALLNPDEDSDSEQDASEDIMWTAERFNQFDIQSEDLITDIEDPRIGEKELAMLADYDSKLKELKEETLSDEES